MKALKYVNLVEIGTIMTGHVNNIPAHISWPLTHDRVFLIIIHDLLHNVIM